VVRRPSIPPQELFLDSLLLLPLISLALLAIADVLEWPSKQQSAAPDAVPVALWLGRRISIVPSFKHFFRLPFFRKLVIVHLLTIRLAASLTRQSTKGPLDAEIKYYPIPPLFVILF
jgi:hypothetical protein